MTFFEKIEKEQLKSEVVPFSVGDSVKVHIRVVEGDRERIQVYSGIVIARRGAGINASFTVRRLSFGEGVEKSFSLHSPRISRIQVERRGYVHRSKLYYLRRRKGKSAMTVRERSF
ncbi:50S ribosomal protein L19 [Candidatus Xiphinematobacter sp. Idaho Grape]|uniref:50S ribosomal protein L19 n=1 Tax=Candidatus Xiphinematobacter sp. Idaho Grape TaxID=1704307 RepID=UPI000706A4D7|nr:50S ribosomal protein L19 [Candidatus Xiphinematobacter sp. Idaho Grape]ALJ56704.1 50S ribosomal protein L19 [Candidatus Xiphinematobacter sp. Idaho Grape]